MKLPTSITVIECNSLLDGGTVEFVATAESGEQVLITINQHAFNVSRSIFSRWLGGFSQSTRTPGRLLLNGRLISPRSERETKIVSLLKTARISTDNSSGWDIEEANRIRIECVDYIQSDAYLEIARTGIVPTNNAG